jgi:hypothetical protein
MNCPQCKTKMQLRIFDLGYGVDVPTKHCTNCQFNVTDEKILAAAMAKRKERMAKEVYIVAIGAGLGVRFPKEFVMEYAIKKGVKVRLKPGKRSIEVML